MENTFGGTEKALFHLIPDYWYLCAFTLIHVVNKAKINQVELNGNQEFFSDNNKAYGDGNQARLKAIVIKIGRYLDSVKSFV